MPWQAGYAARQALRCDKNLLKSLDELCINNWQDKAAGDAGLGYTVLPEAASQAGLKPGIELRDGFAVYR